LSDVITVAIVEDVKALREGLAALLGGTKGLSVVGSFASMEAALDPIEREPPDVLLADIGLPGMSGVEGVRLLKARHPTLQVVMLTVHEDKDHIFEAICAGACGYLLKDSPPARLIEAIHEIHAGGAPMSPEIARKVVAVFQKTATPPTHQLTVRELEVLKMLADGHAYKTAADALCLSPDTIRFHVRHIYEKLHVHSKSEAVLKAFRQGILR
jgi:DNA-binding NarL/FixJ family response regulator